jgi:hypothetical protein
MTAQEDTDFGNQLDAIMAAFSGTSWILADTNFRTYQDPSAIYGRDGFNDQTGGSLPYIDKYNKPRILANQPEYTNTDGRSIIDLFNYIRNDFETLLGSDGLHLSATGEQGFRDFVPARVKYLIQGGPKPAAITPLPKDNIGGIEAKVALSLGTMSETLVNSAEEGLLAAGFKKYLRDDAGVYTPYLYSIVSTGNTDNNVNGGNLTSPNVPTYVGDIYCDEMIADSLYCASTNTVQHVIEGLSPNTAYNFEVLASRGSGSARTTLLDWGDATASINTSTDPAENKKFATATADGSGVITIVQSATLGTFSYLGAISVEKA